MRLAQRWAGASRVGAGVATWGSEWDELLVVLACGVSPDRDREDNGPVLSTSHPRQPWLQSFTWPL